MRFKKTLWTLAVLTALGFAGCDAKPSIEKAEDLTGDGIEDVIVDIPYGFQNGNWLFIGQEDGQYIRAERHKSAGEVEYYQTDDKKVYFFDGENYIESPQKTE